MLLHPSKTVTAILNSYPVTAIFPTNEIVPQKSQYFSCFNSFRVNESNQPVIYCITVIEVLGGEGESFYSLVWLVADWWPGMLTKDTAPDLVLQHLALKW